MKGMTDCAGIFAIVTAIHSYVVMAEVYRFHSNGAYPSAYCYDYVTTSGSAATNIECADKCGRNAQCQGFVYEAGTLQCSQISIININYPDRRCQAGGTRFYAREGPACNQRLIDGPEGVHNNQLSESSYYCLIVEPTAPACQPASERIMSAWNARLSDTRGGWASGYTSQTEYIQVQFYQPTTVSSVVLTGFHSVEQYTTQFKFLYSDDCFSFHEITLENGASVSVMQGNSAWQEVVTRQLPERVKAHCFRIYPLTWYRFPALRFDLDGCY